MMSNLLIYRKVGLLDYEAEELAKRVDATGLRGASNASSKLRNGIPDPREQHVAEETEAQALYTAVTAWLSEGVADDATRDRLEMVRRATFPLAGEP